MKKSPYSPQQTPVTATPIVRSPNSSPYDASGQSRELPALKKDLIKTLEELKETAKNLTLDPKIGIYEIEFSKPFQVFVITCLAFSEEEAVKIAKDYTTGEELSKVTLIPMEPGLLSFQTRGKSLDLH